MSETGELFKKEGKTVKRQSRFKEQGDELKFRIKKTVSNDRNFQCEPQPQASAQAKLTTNAFVRPSRLA